MPYLFMLIIISIIGFLIFRIFKRNSLPLNNYTPFDHIIEGKIENSKQNIPLQDTKHQIEYEEINK